MWLVVLGRVSCFAHTSPKNYATSGPHYVCYNRKSDWFSEFSSLIYYSEIKFPIYKGFLKIHKGKILFFEKLNFGILNYVVNGFAVKGLIAEVLRFLLTPILIWFVYDICHMSTMWYDIICHIWHSRHMSYVIGRQWHMSIWVSKEASGPQQSSL